MDYHVFLTPRGECEGLYVANATAAGFEVRELHHGSSNVAFDYRIVARRKGYEAVRLADKTREFSRPKPITMTNTHGKPVIPNSHDVKLLSAPHISALQSDK